MLVRVHAMNTLDDMLDDRRQARPGAQGHGDHREEGRGVIVLIRETAPEAISVPPRRTRARGRSTADRIRHRRADPARPRGARDDALSNSPARKIVGLEGYGLNIVGHGPTQQGRTMSRKSPRSVLIVEARFYEDIADKLARGAVRSWKPACEFRGLAVPGALEIPLRSASRSPMASSGEPGGTGLRRARLRDPWRDDPLRDRGRESAAGLHATGRRSGRADRQRHPDLRKPRAGLARASVEGRNKGGDAAAPASR